jgi:hypothetical protein
MGEEKQRPSRYSAALLMGDPQNGLYGVMLIDHKTDRWHDLLVLAAKDKAAEQLQELGISEKEISRMFKVLEKPELGTLGAYAETDENRAIEALRYQRAVDAAQERSAAPPLRDILRREYDENLKREGYGIEPRRGPDWDMDK